MNNDDERDYEEEANRRLLDEYDEEEDIELPSGIGVFEIVDNCPARDSKSETE
jgi:hypothetical protein